MNETIKEEDEKKESGSKGNSNMATITAQQAEAPRPSTTDMAAATEAGTKGQEGASSLSISRNINQGTDHLISPADEIIPRDSDHGDIREQGQHLFESRTIQ